MELGFLFFKYLPNLGIITSNIEDNINLLEKENF